MTEVGGSGNAIRQPTARDAYVTPIVTGLLIAAGGLAPWTLLEAVDQTEEAAGG